MSEKSTRIYHLDVVNKDGMSHRFEAIGMNSLKEVASDPQVSDPANLFPRAPPDAAIAFHRPSGRVHLMIGMRDCWLHAMYNLE